MFVPMSTRFLTKLGHMGSKTRTRSQIKGKPCEHSRGHIFDPILNKLSQNVYPNKYWVLFETGSRGVKTRSRGQINENLVNTLEVTVLT